jgi:hypothetical protein
MWSTISNSKHTSKIGDAILNSPTLHICLCKTYLCFFGGGTKASMEHNVCFLRKFVSTKQLPNSFGMLQISCLNKDLCKVSNTNSSKSIF